MDSSWVTWAIQGLAGIALGIIVFFWKKDQAALDRRIGKTEERLDRLDKSIAEMPFVYVTREDFIRAVSSINTTQTETNKKLDRIYELILKATSAKEI